MSRPKAARPDRAHWEGCSCPPAYQLQPHRPQPASQPQSSRLAARKHLPSRATHAPPPRAACRWRRALAAARRPAARPTQSMTQLPHMRRAGPAALGPWQCLDGTGRNGGSVCLRSSPAAAGPPESAASVSAWWRLAACSWRLDLEAGCGGNLRMVAAGGPHPGRCSICFVARMWATAPAGLRRRPLPE